VDASYREFEMGYHIPVVPGRDEPPSEPIREPEPLSEPEPDTGDDEQESEPE
jgi:hypothetical protein